MKTSTGMIAAVTLSLLAGSALAEPTRDCMLEGTVHKGDSSDQQGVNVKFHSASKYDEDANCRMRRGEKMEFKLPADPRVKNAEDGSPVKYRYRQESDGSSKTELISVGA